jgi:hypothetical protein
MAAIPARWMPIVEPFGVGSEPFHAFVDVDL